MTKRGTHKFGWCIVGNHDACYADVSTVKCSCSCHKENAPDLD